MYIYVQTNIAMTKDDRHPGVRINDSKIIDILRGKGLKYDCYTLQLNFIYLYFLASL